MIDNPRESTSLAVRKGLVRWFGACTILWATASLAIAWIARDDAPWVATVWVVVVPAFIGLSAFIVRRMVRTLEALDDDRDGLQAAYNLAVVGSLRDSLTGLGSHRAFQDRLETHTILGREGDHELSLIVVDVDDLKRTNETQGHAGGDELLRATARIINASLRRTDRAFRTGGDEFAVLLPDCGPEEAVAIAWRILSGALSAGSGTLGVEPFSLTVGVSSMPGIAKDRRQLLHQANAALYWGKRHGRTDVQLFDAGRHGIADDWRPLDELASAVIKVATDRMLTPVYQPIHCLRTGRVIGYEGLVRPKPESGFPNAGALFVAAESTGRTVELDLASLDAVLTGARTLDPSLYLSVNLSPRSLESDIFKPQELLTLARRRDIDPTRILVELTEREAVEDMDRLRAAMDLLRSHGVRTAADDVGAGNAGLRLLRELDFDVIKVDLSLVQAGAADNPSGAVLRALRELARQRSQTIVAEGVETPDQLLAVIELEFDAAQGFLLHRPSHTLDAQRLDLARVVFPPQPSPVRPAAAVPTRA